MGKNSKPGSSVCKFLYDDDCTSIFQIPSRLVKGVGDVLPPTATLRVDQSGKSWNVSIEKFRDHYFFTDGWKKFAEEVDLKAREYLLFKSAGLSEFRVSPDESNRDKELNSGDPMENNVSEDGDSFSDQEFTTQLKSYHKNRLVLPKELTNRTGLKKDKKLVLQDVEGRKWPVRVTSRSCGSYALTAGWLDFLIANKVVVGSTMSFKFVSSSNDTVEARVVKEGTNEKALFKFVKRKGDRFVIFDSDYTNDLAKGPENSHETSEHTKGPENSLKTRGHAEVPGNSHKTSGPAEGTEISHIHVKSENEGHFSEEENDFGVGRR